MLAEGNTQHLIIALVQPNGKHGYLTAPRKCQNCLLYSQHVKIIINLFLKLIFLPIGLTEDLVSGIDSNPEVLSELER